MRTRTDLRLRSTPQNQFSERLELSLKQKHKTHFHMDANLNMNRHRAQNSLDDLAYELQDLRR